MNEAKRTRKVFERFNMPCLKCTPDQLAKCEDPRTAIKTKLPDGRIITGCAGYVNYLRRTS